MTHYIEFYWLCQLVFKMALPAKRFAHFSDEELRQKSLDVQNQNTLKNEKKAERAFKEFLEECGQENTNFYVYTESELDLHLAKFCFSALKKKDGDMYKASSLDTLWCGLNRALKRYSHEFDITSKNSTSFIKSINAFDDSVTELKKHGKGFVKNTWKYHSQVNFHSNFR